MNRSVGDTAATQLLRDDPQVRLVARSQCDRDRARRKQTRGALAGCVNQLGRKDSPGKVAPHDANVREKRLRPTGLEPATPEVLTLRAPPVGQTLTLCGDVPSDDRFGRPPGSSRGWLVVPLSPGGASEAVKLA